MSVLVALAPYEQRERLLSSTEMMARAGITYRQVDYWARSGILHPVESTPGSGNPRQYPESEVKIAKALAALAALDRRNGFGSIVKAAIAAIRRGERVFELIPGVTVDLDRLGGP